MSCRSPAASTARSVSGSGFKAPSLVPTVPLGAVFVLQLLQFQLKLGFWRLLSLQAAIDVLVLVSIAQTSEILDYSIISWDVEVCYALLWDREASSCGNWCSLWFWLLVS